MKYVVSFDLISFTQTMATSNLIWKFCPYKYVHNPSAKYNMLLNNILNSLNAYIKENRDKLIITMMEIIRRQLTRKMYLKIGDENLLIGNMFKNLKQVVTLQT